MVAVAGESAKEMPIDVLMHMTRLESWCWGVRALRLNDFHSKNRTDRSARSRGTQHMIGPFPRVCPVRG